MLLWRPEFLNLGEEFYLGFVSCRRHASKSCHLSFFFTKREFIFEEKRS